jgi:hypothetical protein
MTKEEELHYLLLTMKATKFSTVVAKSTIRTERFLKRRHIFRITVKTLHPPNRSIDVIIFCVVTSS